MGERKNKQYPLVIKKDFWSKKYVSLEPYTLIRPDATGGFGYDEEWHGDGNYSVKVDAGRINNIYCYKGRLHGNQKKYFDPKRIRRNKKQTYNLSLYCEDPSGPSILVGTAKGKSLLDCRHIIVDMIYAFEKSNRFKEELWSRVLHADKRIPVLKKVGDDLVWIATTWHDLTSAVTQTNPYSQFKIGIFPSSSNYYARSVNVRYKFGDNNEYVKYYDEPYYSKMEHFGGGSYASGRMKDDALLKQQVDNAIWNLNDPLSSYIALQLYLKHNII